MAGELIQRHHVGTVAGGVVRIGMGLEEQAVDADGHGGPGQGLDHRAISAGGGAQPAGLLHAVRGVEHDRNAPQGLHLRESTRMSVTSRP